MQQNIVGKFARLAALAAALALVCVLGASAAMGKSAGASTPKPAPAAPCTATTLLPNLYNLSVIELSTLCLINQQRAALHLRPLHLNTQLQSVAAGQARDMVIGDYFGDNSLSGQTPSVRIAASHYLAHASHYWTAQNIGWGTFSAASPAGMVQAWMNSPPHRAIILTVGYRDVGVGVAPAAPSVLAAGAEGATYTVEFGARQVKAAATVKATGR
jgi:uncharacterized protein YkwD